ncbi:MAG TPA: insulinase family protein, partial [Chitinophagales bacterium]|nr:insulinase family protein [Chitinophagales bacterium]
MRKATVCLLLFFFSSSLLAQDFLAKNEYYFTLTNRLDLLVVEDTAAQNMTLALVFKCGSFTEGAAYDGMSFLYERILTQRLREQMKQIIPDTRAFAITSETSLEYLFAGITFPTHQLADVLQAVYRCVTPPVNQSEIQDAVAFSNSESARLAADTFTSLEQKIQSVLWIDDYKKRTTVTSWTDSSSPLIPERINKLKSMYFCPRSCLMLVKGKVVHKAVYEKVKDIFTQWERCTINPFTKYPDNVYKTVLRSAQIVEENQQMHSHFFRIAFPGPNTFEDKKGNYCMLVLASMLSNPHSRLRRMLADSCHVASVSLQNDLAKNISQVTFQFSLHPAYLPDGFECARSLLLQPLNDSIINAQELESAKQLLIASYRQTKADNARHVHLIAKYWASVTLNEYSTFEDSIRAITLQDMKTMAEKYFLGRKYVAGLSISPALRKSSRIDSVFTSASPHIASYRINFLKNSAVPASAADDSVLVSVIQFLKINPELKIKVNGVCHKSELLEVTDKEMLAWKRSLQGFIVNPPSVARKKFRLDIYRSLTVIRKLIAA